jgi:hypothetical protein
MFPELPNFHLGEPTGDPYQVQNPGVHRRDFAFGYVIANVNAPGVGGDCTDPGTNQTIVRGDGLIIQTRVPLGGPTDVGTGTQAAYGINVVWTVPEADGTYGAVSAFDLRCMAGGGSITESNFADLPEAAVVAAGWPGSSMCYSITSLTKCHNYTFAMRSGYSCGGESYVSNNASSYTLCSGSGYPICGDDLVRDPVPPEELEFRAPAPNPTHVISGRSVDNRRPGGG